MKSPSRWRGFFLCCCAFFVPCCDGKENGDETKEDHENALDLEACDVISQITCTVVDDGRPHQQHIKEDVEAHVFPNEESRDCPSGNAECKKEACMVKILGRRDGGSKNERNDYDEYYPLRFAHRFQADKE